MRCLIAVIALLPCLRDDVALKPTFQKFDKLAVSCTVKTDIQSSTGRHSKYEMKINYSSEVEKAEGDKAIFDCGVQYLKITGTFKGKPVDYEWSRSSGGSGRPIPALEGKLKKGWKITLDGAKGFTLDDQALPVNDELPLLNPGVFLGFSVPVPFATSGLGKMWQVKDQKFNYFAGFGLNYGGSLLFVDKDKNVAKISGDLKFMKYEDEVPIEGGVNVRGKGSAMMEYDLASGRPLRGATALKVHVGQGGFKRDINQVIEFEVR